MRYHFNSYLPLNMDLFLLLNWGVKSQPMKPVEGKIMQCLANNNIAPYSLVNASCSSNGPIKGSQPWSSLGMSQIDYLTMSKLCSQITDNRDGVCAHVCPGPNWANKGPFSHLFRLQSAHAKVWMGRNGSKEGGSGWEGGTSWIGDLLVLSLSKALFAVCTFKPPYLVLLFSFILSSFASF